MRTAFPTRTASAWPGVIEQYRKHLPVDENTPVVTLLEGNTPLIPAPNFVKEIGGDLLSREVALRVPSALVGLTALFGMGRGVPPPL